MSMFMFKRGVLVEAGNMKCRSFQNRDPGEEEDVFILQFLHLRIYTANKLCGTIGIER